MSNARRRLLGQVCLGGLILMLGGCAALVFDELSDMRGSGTILSIAKFGQTNDQLLLGAALNLQGNIVMTGMTLDTAKQDLGCGLAGKGGLDMFVTWVNPNDSSVLCPTSRLWGGVGNDVPRGIAVNPINGGIGIVGLSTGDFDCGKGSLANNNGGRDVAFATFVGDTCSWQQSIGDDADQEGQAITFDSVGTAFIGGRFKGMLDLDVPLTNPDGTGFDAFIAKLSLGVGTQPWSLQAGGAGEQEVQAISVYSDNTLIASGRFTEQLDFQCAEPLLVQDPGQDALFVAALNHNTQTCTWQKTIAQGPTEDSPLSLAVAKDGDIFVAGGFRTRTLFPDDADCQQVNTTLGDDIFVAKLNINGDCQWSRRFGGVDPTSGEHQRAQAIVVDAVSNVYVTGQFYGSIAFDSTHQHQSLGDSSAFVLKLNSAGDVVWSNVIAGTGSASGNAIVLDSSGKFVFVAGSFRDGSLNLVGESLVPSGLDVFLAKLTR